GPHIVRPLRYRKKRADCSGQQHTARGSPREGGLPRLLVQLHILQSITLNQQLHKLVDSSSFGPGPGLYGHVHWWNSAVHVHVQVWVRRLHDACGGWDSNPRRPSPQGPKPRAGYDHAFCPLDLALVPPQISEARTTPRPWANKDYLAAHTATISFPGPSDDKGRSPACRIGTAWGRR